MSMNRFSSILISSIYFLLTIGITLNIHYCMGQVESVSWMPFTDICCCDTGDIPKGCCGDEWILLQYRPNEQILTSYTPEFKAELLEILDFSWVKTLENGSQQNNISYYIKPPPSARVPLWLKNSTFIFYG